MTGEEVKRRIEEGNKHDDPSDYYPARLAVVGDVLRDIVNGVDDPKAQAQALLEVL